MVVALDGSPTGGGDLSVSVLRFTHTCGASATDLKVDIATDSNADVCTGVFWNGTALTLLTSDVSQATRSVWTWILRSPQVGFFTVQANFSGTVSTTIGIATSFTGSNGAGDVEHNGGNSSSASTTNTSVGSADLVSDFEVVTTGAVATSIQTLQFTQAEAGITCKTSTATGTGSVSMGYNYTAGGNPFSTLWAMTSVVLKSITAAVSAGETVSFSESRVALAELSKSEFGLFADSKSAFAHSAKSDTFGLSDVRALGTAQSDAVGLVTSETLKPTKLVSDALSITQIQFGLKYKYLLETATIEIDDAHVSIANKLLPDSLVVVDTARHGPLAAETLSFSETKIFRPTKGALQTVGISDLRSIGWTRSDALGLQDLRKALVGRLETDTVSLVENGIRMLLKYLVQATSIADFHDIAHTTAVLDVFVIAQTVSKRDSLAEYEVLNLQENAAESISKALQEVFSALEHSTVSYSKYVQQLFGLTDAEHTTFTKILTLPISISDAKALTAIKILSDTYGLNDQQIAYIVGSYVTRTRGSIRAGNRNSG